MHRVFKDITSPVEHKIARCEDLKGMTEIDAHREPPEDPPIVLTADAATVEQRVPRLRDFVRRTARL